jgi:hypothetical protein
MKRWWVSWWCPDDLYGTFELHSPWWVSGERDGARSICAAVMADSEYGAKAIIAKSHDDDPGDIEWRCCDERTDDWEPFNTRFRRAAWMQWP